MGSLESEQYVVLAQLFLTSMTPTNQLKLNPFLPVGQGGKHAHRSHEEAYLRVSNDKHTENVYVFRFISTWTVSLVCSV
jgi:hypothetical protein